MKRVSKLGIATAAWACNIGRYFVRETSHSDLGANNGPTDRSQTGRPGRRVQLEKARK